MPTFPYGLTEPALPKPHARRAERARVRLPAYLRRSGEARGDVEVRDLSVLGFCVDTHRQFAPDTRVWLTLPGLQPLVARVVRQAGREIGGEFLVPLHPAVFQRLASSTPAGIVRH